MDNGSCIFLIISGSILSAIPVGVILGIFIIVLLLLCSAMVAGAEVAFFSLTKPILENLKNSRSGSEKLVATLLTQPKRLLATLLIANNFINVGIVIISTFVTSEIITDEFAHTSLGWVLQVIVVTFLILMVGEVVPKVYATQHALSFAVFMAYPLYFLKKV